MADIYKSSREIEIKLLVRPGDLNRLKSHTFLWAGFEKAGPPVQQNSVYFDDRRHSLQKAGLSLRVRHVGERRIQTIKALNGSGAISRAEWEHEIATGRPDLSTAMGTAFGPVLAENLRDPLEPAFETRVARTSFPLQFGSSEIIVSLDQGEIHTGQATAPISELELELNRGSPADLFQLAIELAESLPLELSYSTKSDRGYTLLSGIKSVPTAREVHLHAGMSRADAFRAIAHECLRHAIENRPGVARSDPSALHQTRVAFRRLRTAMSLFKDMVDGPGAETVKEKIKWLRDQTGSARDLDVFIGEVVVPIKNQHPKEPAVTSLHNHLRRRRLKAYKQAREAVISPEFRKLIFQAATWAEDGDWRSTADELTRARQDAPIGLFAGEQLSELHRKVRKKGKALRQLDEARRHTLRVQAKKLRYATEFYASLATTKKEKKRARALTNTLRDFQDALGGLNDIAVRKSLSAEIAGKVGPGSARKEQGRARIFVAGLIAGHQEAHIPPLLDKAVDAYAEFRDVKPFWKSLKPKADVPPTTPAAAKPPVHAAGVTPAAEPLLESERKVA